VWWVGDRESEPLWRGGELDDEDPSFALFHQDPGSGLACASCHPEGEDDGHVWDFGAGVEGVVVPGPRRTLPLGGGVSARAPYHWMGELRTDDDLVRSSFTGRMGGPELAPDAVDELFVWLDGLRAVRAAPVGDPALRARGRELFMDAGCASCHAGPALTDGRRWNVRPHQPAFKTPSLVGLGMRTSLMHDGCALTLRDRLTGPESCGGGDQHGSTSTLGEADLVALEAYLTSL
jgi:mono/diheme cytochrome c family protein